MDPRHAILDLHACNVNPSKKYQNRCLVMFAITTASLTRPINHRPLPLNTWDLNNNGDSNGELKRERDYGVRAEGYFLFLTGLGKPYHRKIASEDRIYEVVSGVPNCKAKHYSFQHAHRTPTYWQSRYLDNFRRFYQQRNWQLIKISHHSHSQPAPSSNMSPHGVHLGSHIQ